ncbi:TPA: hypothetical protein PTV74_003249 [Clostridium botulinum]|nr:hypothetical protein [Clostridium botulinum]HDK7206403.1 hypothetical protein [Clostridium botulinum]HDK7210139.1 hypothetical protein [Clostridium botulinum]HDK7265588.1 hypothetical protein [Clostridium botulinum]HDK7269436.1 hypothetical protein [Clostridium botulinum]
MKLYFVEILNNNEVVNVQHMFANEGKEIHKRMDNFLEECKKYNLLDEYNGYKFHEVNLIDGVNINEIFKNYEVVNNNKIIKRREN